MVPTIGVVAAGVVATGVVAAAGVLVSVSAPAERPPSSSLSSFLIGGIVVDACGWKEIRKEGCQSVKLRV